MNSIPGSPEEAELSQAAERAIENAVQDFRTRVTSIAKGYASSNPVGTQTVGVADVSAAVSFSGELISGTDEVRTSTPRTRFILIASLAYSLIGIIGLAAYIQNMKDAHIATQDIAFLASGMLMGSSIFPIANLLFDKVSYFKRSQRSAREMQFKALASWMALENAMRIRVSGLKGESHASMPIGNLIETLRTAGVIKSGDRATIMRALSLRNKLAHGIPVTLEDENLRVTFTQLDRIRQKLLAGG
jgi:hypothetical protein